MLNTGDDRRRAWRYPANLDVRLPEGIGVTRDVSASGIYFETASSLTAGQPITFSVALNRLYPDVPLDLKCSGRIVRVEQRGGRLGLAATIESWSFEQSRKFGGGAAKAEQGRPSISH